MRKNIVAGNWKMNKNLQEGIALAKELNEALAADKPNCDVIICTPFIHLASVTPIVDKAVIGVGAENCADKVSELTQVKFLQKWLLQLVQNTLSGVTQNVVLTTTKQWKSWKKKLNWLWLTT